jgi:putative OPT family oligopeptide transporter
LVGNSNNPASALAICAFLIASLLFVVLGFDADRRLIAAVLLISSFVCTAAAVSGDTAQHLKTGALLGATPRRQQAAQLIGVVTFAFVVAPIVVLLARGYGLGTDRPDSLKAPQAVLFANLANMVFGNGRLPYTMLWTGAAVAAGVIAVDALLLRGRTSLRLYVMPVAIGMYLPISLTVPLFAGGLASLVQRRATRRYDEETRRQARTRSTLLWSGLVTGEALVGVSVAVPHLLGWHLPVRLLDNTGLSLAVFILIILLVQRLALPGRAKRNRSRQRDHEYGRNR